ncbi:hypothetical protein IJ384_03275 [bacterium]|nr:hypothetical protein [bacterium]
MAHYVRVKIGRRTIILWNGLVPLFEMRDTGEKALDSLFLPRLRKALSAKKKEITRAEKSNLDYLGNYTPKLLRQMVRYKFNKFLDSIDRTEVAKKSNKKIY